MNKKMYYEISDNEAGRTWMKKDSDLARRVHQRYKFHPQVKRISEKGQYYGLESLELSKVYAKILVLLKSFDSDITVLVHHNLQKNLLYKVVTAK